MSRRIHFFIAGLLAGLAPRLLEAQAAPVAQAVPEKKALIRIIPTRDEVAERKVFAVLEAYLEPMTITLSKPVAVADLLREHCGTAKPVVQEFFQRANPELARADSLRPAVTVRIPPCSYSRGQLSVKVPEGANPVKLATSVMGISGPRSDSAVRSVNPDRAISGVPVTRPTTITVPFETRPSEWVLKNKDPIATTLLRNALSAISKGTVEGDAGDTRLVRDVFTPSTDRGCTANAGAEPWPYSQDDVLKALLRNESRFGVVPGAGPRTLVGIADTGIEEEAEARLPLHLNALERTGGWDDDKDGNGYFHDVFGVTLHGYHGFPIADAQNPSGWHGTAVAGLAAGGLTGPALAAEIRKRLDLTILSIVDKQSVNTNPPSYLYLMDNDAIARSVVYAPQGVALSVINLSIESAAPMLTFTGMLGQAQKLLVVVAAGNDGRALEDHAFYPVRERSSSKQMISVGAHVLITSEERARVRSGEPGFDGSLVLDENSNYGPLVDLAAPGCHVPTFDMNGKTTEADGTSFGAPLVSFTAALLKAEGITAPSRLRDRIIASTDYIPGLPVFSSGVLNIPKALSVHEDLIEMRDGRVILGRLEGIDGIKVAGGFTGIDNVLKIVPFLDGTVRVVTSSVDVLTVKSGSTPLTQVMFRETGSAAATPILLKDIYDIVLRAPEFRGR